MELYFNNKSYNADNEFIYESYSINEDDSQLALVNNSSTKLSPDDFEPTKFKEMIGKITDFKSFINTLSNKNVNSIQVDYIAKLDSILEAIKKFNIDILVLSSIKLPTNA